MNVDITMVQCIMGVPPITTNLAGVFGQIPRCTTGLCRKRYVLYVILLVFSQTSFQFILVYKLDYMHIKVFRKHVVGIVI